MNENLLALLSKSRNVMRKVESGDFTPSGISEKISMVDAPLLEMNQLPNGVPRNQNLHNEFNFTEEKLAKSKLPPAIKEAMRNSIQPVLNPNETFSLNDVKELIEKPLPSHYNKVNESQHTTQVPAGMMLVNEEKLKNMMRDYMLEFMTTVFTKNLSEDVIKKTISSLIKEGKITVKQQIKK